MDQKMLEIMERMEKNSKKQVFYARLQFLLTAIALVCCIAMLVSFMRVLPQLQDAVQQAETAITNIEQVMEKINAIDIEALNQAIRDLSDVINPITTFFNKFRIG